MIRSEKNNFIIYRWPSLDRLGVNAFTAAGLNTALHAPGTEPREEILHHRALLSDAAGVAPESWVCGRQVHSSHGAVIRSSHRGRGAAAEEDALARTDALILSEPGLNGMIFTADCLPLVLYDTKRKIGALIHAGWRGAAAGIVIRVLDTMRDELGCHRKNILAAAGPAINACCYQVDRPVYTALTENFPETRGAFTPDGKDHWRFSLEQAVFYQLGAQGISEEQCEGSGLCSGCEEDLFSWRREGSETGRMATCLCL